MMGSDTCFGTVYHSSITYHVGTFFFIFRALDLFDYLVYM